jgi:rare lipoprotein A
MRWNDKRLLNAATIALAIGGCGAAEAKNRDKRMTADQPVLRDEVPVLGEPYTIGGQRFEPKDDNAFDETGYSIVMTPDMSGGSTQSGEPYNPGAMTGSHRILPIPSYAEVTNLETGKTILIRINDRGPMLKDRVVALSPAAAEALNIASGSNAPVRVRRVNPPGQEKNMLRMGNAAADRLDTPPALLSALKRRLIESGTPKPKDVVMTAPAPRPINPLQSKPEAARVPAVAKPGANYDTSPSGSAQRPTPRPARRPAPMAQPRPQGSDRFIIEDGSGQTVVTVQTGENDAPAPVRASGAVSYVQIAAFGVEARAVALARKVGGSAQKAGSVWRVRTGPYADEASARSALSDAVSKGYRDARISR